MADRRERERQEDDVMDARQWAAQHESGGGRTSLKIPDGAKLLIIKKPGVYRLDIIPYIVGDNNPAAKKGKKYWHRTFWVHNNVGPNNDKYVCRAKELNEACPICEFVNARLKHPDTTEEEESALYKMRPKERQLFNVVDRDKDDGQVMIWEQSYHTFGKHLKNKLDRMDPDEDFGLFADLKRGYTLKLGASEETAGKMKFIEFGDIEFKKREPYDPDFIDQAYCLDDCIKVLDYEELKRVFLQVPADGNGASDDDKPAKKKGRDEDDRPARKAPPKSRDDDEDDDEDDKPATKSRPSRASRDDDDEDDKPAKKAPPRSRDDDDDEDNSPPPRKKPKEEPEELEVGDLVMYGRLECEILSMSKDGTSLKLQDDDGEVYPGIAPDKVKKIDLTRPAPKPSKSRDDDDEDAKPVKKSTPKSRDDDDDEDNSPPPPRKKR